MLLVTLIASLLGMKTKIPGSEAKYLEKEQWEHVKEQLDQAKISNSPSFRKIKILSKGI